jgi:O-antigen ligase
MSAVALRAYPARAAVAACAALAGVVLGVLAGVNPALAILASVAAGYVLLTFADLSVGLALFVVLSFVEVVPVGGVAGVLTKLLGLVLALSWMALVATREKRSTDIFSSHPLAAYCLLLLVGWSALSSVWSLDSSDAFGTAYRLLLNAILFVIVYTAVDSPRVARQVTAAFVVGAALSAVYGLVVTPGDPDSAGRLAGGALDPNELASALVGGFVLSLGLAAGSKRGSGTSVIGLCGAAFCLISLFLTASRGGLIAIIGAMVIAIVFAGRWRLVITLIAVVIAGTGYFYFSALAPESARERIALVTQGEAGQEESRATIWKVGWRMFEAQPVHGVGAGNFSDASLKYVVRPGEAPRSDRLVSRPAVAHNSYLEVLAELGVIGGALFLALIAFSVGSAVLAARRFQRLGDVRMEVLSRALVVATIGVLVADFFISQEASKQLWLLLGLGPAFLGIAQRATSASSTSIA